MQIAIGWSDQLDRACVLRGQHRTSAFARQNIHNARVIAFNAACAQGWRHGQVQGSPGSDTQRRIFQQKIGGILMQGFRRADFRNQETLSFSA